jgi:hypothetical protein
VQVYALLVSSTFSFAALASIVVSIATISLSSSTMCFDFDLSPDRRAKVPTFYGYIPNNSRQRTIVFFSMFLFTIFQVSLRCLGVAVMAAVSPTATSFIILGDVILFMVFKIVRNDFRYWFRFDETLSWVMSVAQRLVTKLMVDFTVMVQLRHPNELTGVYWSLNLLLGQCFSFVAVYVYSRSKVNVAEEALAYRMSQLWILLVVFEGGFIISFTIFLATINKSYRSTFFSSISGKQFQQKIFRDGDSDEVKSIIFKNHKSYYVDIWSEVDEWVRENWEGWIEEKPEWFNERVKASVPREMIPVGELEDLESRRATARKSSLTVISGALGVEAER